jgi:hypothetical protein
VNELDVTGLLELRALQCPNNNLVSLNVAGLQKLERLNCGGNRLNELDAGGLAALRELFCFNNGLTRLNLKGTTNLVWLDCERNKLTTLDVADLKNLEKLNCSQSGLTSLNLEGAANLNRLDCERNELTQLDVTDSVNLRKLDCSFNKLAELDVAGASELRELQCHNNALLVSLNVAGLKKLEKINCSGNKSMKELDAGGLIGLQDLQCADSGLTNLNLEKATSLINLWCVRSKLTQLDAAGLRSLTRLDCSQNELTSLNVAGAMNLQRLNCTANKLTELDVAESPNLKALSCSDNNLTSLNVIGLKRLETISCSGNKSLKILDVRELTGLKDLECTDSGLTNLNLEGATNLTRLHCGSNALTSLDLSRLERLEHATAEYNPLAALAIGAKSRVRVSLSLQKGKALKLISPLKWKPSFSGAVHLEPLPDGVLLTAWRGMANNERSSRIVSASDRNVLSIRCPSDGTDIQTLGKHRPGLKDLGKDTGTVLLEIPEPWYQDAVTVSDFRLSQGASVRFGGEGFDSLGTTPVPLQMGRQSLYVVVANADAESRYRIEIVREEPAPSAGKRRKHKQSDDDTKPSPTPGKPSVLLEEGHVLAKQGKDREAIAVWEKAVSEGNGDAAFEIGALYQRGGKGQGKDREIPETPAKAVEWYAKAMAMGSPRGCIAMAFLYADGYGPLPQDEEKAFELAWNIEEEDRDDFIKDRLALFYTSYWRTRADLAKARQIAERLSNPQNRKKRLDSVDKVERFLQRMPVEHVFLEARKNRTRFDGRYGGRRMTLAGYAGKIESDEKQGYVLELRAKEGSFADAASYVDCRFEKKHKELLRQLRQNGDEKIVVNGYYRDPRQDVEVEREGEKKGEGVLVLVDCEVTESGTTVLQQRALRILNELNNLHAAAFILRKDRRPATPEETARLEAELAAPLAVGKLLAPYVDNSGKYDDPKYLFTVKTFREGKKWLVGYDLTQEAEGVRHFLKEEARRSRRLSGRLYDEDLLPYNGGNIIYEAVTDSD